MRVTVECCPACGIRHEGLDIEAMKAAPVTRTITVKTGGHVTHRFERISPDWDFRYTCPVKGTEVNLNEVLEAEAKL